MGALLGLLSFFMSPIGRYIAIAGVSVLAIGGAYLKGDIHGYHKGRDEVQAKWDAATAADIKRGDEARREAEAFVVKPPSRFYRSFHPGRVPNDKWDRDKGAVQPVAPYSLLSVPRHPGNSPLRPSPQHDRPAPRVLVKSSYCETVRWAAKNFTQEQLDHYRSIATPQQLADAEACLKGV